MATLQKRLKGKLPLRENVQTLLDEIVNTNSLNSCKAKQESSCTATSTSAFSETDHRISSHKHLLAENYAIKFPGPKQRLPASQGICISNNLDDFKLALKLQHEEISTPKSSEQNLMTWTQISRKQNPIQ